MQLRSEARMETEKQIQVGVIEMGMKIWSIRRRKDYDM